MFTSGAAALIYQTLWVKQLGLVVGVDVYAVSIVVSAFFLGLASGAYFIGKYADTTGRPLKIILILESCIAALGVLTTYALIHIPTLFVNLESSVGILAWSIPFIIIALPAFFMGGTLPVFVRFVAPSDHSIGKISGTFYAANTMGAIVGAVIVPFILIPKFGIYGTGLFAAFLNLIIVGVCAVGARQTLYANVATGKVLSLSREARMALALYTIAGGIALGYEVVWSQAIAPFLSSRVYAFAVMLGMYLFGLVVGSFIYAQYADRIKNSWKAFGLLIAGAAISAAAIFTLAGPWIFDVQDFVGRWLFKAFSSDMLANVGRFTVTSAVVLLIPTMFLGAAFPAAVRLIAGTDRVGHDLGTVVAWNTLGGITGTLLTGFVLIPNLGIVHSIAVLTVSAVFLASIALIRSGRSNVNRVTAATLLIMTIVLAINTPENLFSELLGTRHDGEIVFYDESPAGSVAVLKQKTASGSFNRLYIQGVSNSGNSITSQRYMRLQGLLPLIVHKGEPKSALVIGFGTGITLGSLLSYPDLEIRKCAELIPGVVKAAKYFAGNQNVAADQRVEIILRDGRQELLASQAKYDLITLEPPPPPAAGVVNLYSQEFYELASARLNENGMVAQWWPLPTQNLEDSKALVKSFLNVFPYVTLWSTELHETLIIGSQQPFEFDYSRIKKRYEYHSVRSVLEEVGVRSVDQLLSTYISDTEGLREFVGDADPITDIRPSIEYSKWVRKGEFPRVITEVSQIGEHLTLVGANETIDQSIIDEREKLWTLYRAGYYFYQRDFENWDATLKRIVPELKSNRYFGSFVNLNNKYQ